MLRIHTFLRKWSLKKVFELHLQKINPFDSHVPCIKIKKSELLFEQYRMDLNQEKYDIEIQNDDTIERNQILFDFMQRTFNHLDGLYSREIYLLIDAIIEDQLRKQSATEIEKLNIGKSPETKERNVHLNLLQRSLF